MGMSFEKAYEEYLNYASNRHKKQGFDTIVKNFKLHILPYFKDKNITDVTKLDIINWQNNILKNNFSNNFHFFFFNSHSIHYIFSSIC